MCRAYTVAAAIGSRTPFSNIRALDYPFGRKMVYQAIWNGIHTVYEKRPALYLVPCFPVRCTMKSDSGRKKKEREISKFGKVLAAKKKRQTKEVSHYEQITTRRILSSTCSE